MRHNRSASTFRMLTCVAVAAATLVIAPAGPSAAEANEGVGSPLAARSMTVNGQHSCMIVHSGSVKCWGINGQGRLGLGDINARTASGNDMGDKLEVVQLGSGRIATALASGFRHTCARLDNGTVKCWGSGGFGQTGQEDTDSRGDEPGEMGNSLASVDLGAGRTATAITAGTSHTCALLDNGTVKCWGANAAGQLGLGDVLPRGDGPAEMGDLLPAVDLGTGRTATAISAGSSHTCARLDNGTVKCWGLNDTGQLGLGNTTNRGDNAGEMGNSLPAVSLGTGRTATTITASPSHTCARLDNASLKCWGLNNFGQLGLGDVLTRGDAANEMGDSLPAISLGAGRTVTGVTTGTTHTCALLDNAAVKCWGQNGSGRLGLGDLLARGDAAGEMGDALPAVTLGTNRTVLAVSAGETHTCARLNDDSVKCWGANDFGRLGIDGSNRGDVAGEMGDNLPAVDLGSIRPATAVAAGSAHSCAVLNNGNVKCWGANSTGQLGQGDLVGRGDAEGEMGDALRPVNLGTGRTATAVTAGSSHTCALLDNATVKCWGGNSSGQLGLGDNLTRGDGPNEMGDNLPAVNLGTGRTATAISAGSGHTCALLDNGTLKCWGQNTNGQLGVGDTSARGDAGGEMGNSLPAVSLGTGRTVARMSAGRSHSCAVLDNAALKCWGNNNAGQLGLGDALNRGDAAGEMGDALPAVSLGTGRTATTASAGELYTCATLDNGTVKCWGSGSSGRLGLGDTVIRGDNPSEMGDSLPAVSLGTGRTATAVTTGRSSGGTCARLDNARIKCWGSSSSGQGGLGDSITRGDGPGEMGDSLPFVALGAERTVSQISSGFAHVCARLDDASVKCWGNGSSGELGQRVLATLGDGPNEMGDLLFPVDLGTAVLTGITGTVFDSVTAQRVSGAFVMALRATDFSLARGAVASGAGQFSLAVPAGDYRLYVVDPTDQHIAGFSPGSPVTTVPLDTVVTADPLAVPTRGAITGTITTAGPNTAISGAAAIALNNSGTPETVATLNSGTYTLRGLNPGNHFVTFIDPAGAHATRFFPNSPDVPNATLVSVTAGGSTVANGSLPTQTAVGTGAPLTGTVTEQGTGVPLGNVFVMALRATDFSLARGATTNSNGAYSLDVTAGAYKIIFIDRTGLHNAEWHDNQPSSGLGGATSVTAPAVTNAALTANTGSFSGSVTDDVTFTAVPGAWVLAIGPNGVAGGAVTAANGTYSVAGLAPGNYRAVFVDPVGGRLIEYFENSPDFAGATPFIVSAGANVNNLDGVIGRP